MATRRCPTVYGSERSSRGRRCLPAARRRDSYCRAGAVTRSTRPGLRRPVADDTDQLARRAGLRDDARRQTGRRRKRGTAVLGRRFSSRSSRVSRGAARNSSRILRSIAIGSSRCRARSADSWRRFSRTTACGRHQPFGTIAFTPRATRAAARRGLRKIADIDISLAAWWPSTCAWNSLVGSY